MEYIIGQSRTGRGGAAADAVGGLVDESGVPTAAAVGAAGGGGDAGLIVDGTQDSFMQDVLEASRSLPVLVDFWASWCGPCRQLTPVLEKIVRSAGGRVKLVKIDIDANRALAQQLTQVGLPLQSIPLVAAFWKGQILDLFQGALPESEIRRFVEGLLKEAGGGGMPSADLIAAARAALEANSAEEAAGLFSQTIEIEPENPAAWGGLARALILMGDEDAAEGVLADVPAKIADHAEVTGARAALELKREGRKAAEAAEGLRRRLAANPADHEARYELAAALNAAGKRQEAADELLAIMRQDRAWNDDAARLQLIRLFDSWGHDDPATLQARRRMSSLLFS
ncbi:co-chaperone YbbN [Nguyenibacter vanlangensis]|uniref:Co-chaperone YbbN n=3 Tax=Nguyenibacter vanlangensis TaxID=1216886 RepID=A0ABZ3D3T5_9PROT